MKLCPECGNDKQFHRLGCNYEAFEPLRNEIKQFKAKLARAEETIKRAASYTGFEGYACPLCVYEKGVFIKFCASHERIDQQAKRAEWMQDVLEEISLMGNTLACQKAAMALKETEDEVQN